MNKSEQEQLTTTHFQTCPECGFDANPVNAICCFYCNHPLYRKDSKTDRLSAIPWSTVPLLFLLLLSGGLVFFWRKNAVSLKQAVKDDLSDASSTVQSPETNTPTSASGLQLQDSLEAVTSVPRGVFFYGGAMASAGIRSQRVVNEIKAAQPQFHLSYLDPLAVPPDSSVGIKMVLDGELSFCESFRPLKQSEYDLARSRGFNLKQVPVAINGIAFYTNPNIKLPGVSLSQIEQIYRGELTNWRQLGGPDLPIVPVSQNPKTKDPSSLGLQGLPGSIRSFSPIVRVVRDTTHAIRAVAATPGAIGYGAQALVVSQRTIRPLGLAKGQSNNYVQPMTKFGTVNKKALVDGSYPLIRKIFVIFREDGELDELAGRAYANMLLSQEGQILIDEAGYLPIRY